MAKDKNADKRLEYNRQILDIEREQDEIQSQKREMKRALENFENEIFRSFNRLQELDDEMIRQGSIAAQWEQQEHQGRNSYIRNFINNQEEEVTTAYSKMSQETENKKEELQKERDSLAWD
ncbi:hypothetical protein [Lactococcus lactis]|uniref:Uncharacterized protein n=1 Tax=Lactococcus lactis TaxID=1358 RepID=A0AAW8UJ16_9LACT|nr:hypothetical protein [Lactococcus lactis]MDT2882068.1 hypothetical protein [Lactococcus lactis]MDT2946773.1 hypothetical protein [Lactococcus lactis]MDT2947593.1 hypothetical protein [Lactococcus lactis]